MANKFDGNSSQAPIQQQEGLKQVPCQNRDHNGAPITGIITKKERDQLETRLVCLQCQLGTMNSYSRYIAQLDVTLKDPLKALEFTNFDNINQKFITYYLPLNPSIDEDYIKQKCDDLKLKIDSMINRLQASLIKQVTQYRQFLDGHKGLAEEFGKRVCTEKLKSALDKFQNTPDGRQDLEDEVDEYVRKLHDDTDGEKLQKKIEEMRVSQKLFYNPTKFDVAWNEIRIQIDSIKTLISENSFPQSQLSTKYIEDIFKDIYPEKKLADVSKELELIYRGSRDGLNSKNISAKYDTLTKWPLLIICKSANGQIFGGYCTSVNGSKDYQESKSIMFQMTKQRIFKWNVSCPLTLTKNANSEAPILQFGNQDLVIKHNFQSCTSKIGSGFNLDGQAIGDPCEYFANASTFEIVDMEIFIDKGLPKQQQQFPFPFQQLQQQPPPIQQPPQFPTKPTSSVAQGPGPSFSSPPLPK